MRALRLARPVALACLAIVVLGTAAFAQPPRRAKRDGPSALSKRAAVSRAITAQETVAALAYMSGKQALVGWHSPSMRPLLRDAQGRPVLALTHLNRNESLVLAPANEDGGFASTDLDRIAHLLRAMSGEEHPIDPRAIAIVYAIAAHFDASEIRVVSGYRVPTAGSRSNHGKGRAVDLIVPGVADEDVARFARERGFVGVGVYPASQFVHVDIRPRSYFWVDYSGPHSNHRERGILGDLAFKSDAAALERGVAPVESFAIATDVDGALQACGLSPPAPPAEDDEEEEN